MSYFFKTFVLARVSETIDNSEVDEDVIYKTLSMNFTYNFCGEIPIIDPITLYQSSDARRDSATKALIGIYVKAGMYQGAEAICRVLFDYKFSLDKEEDIDIKPEPLILQE